MFTKTFHKTLPKSSYQIYWISVGFYEICDTYSDWLPRNFYLLFCKRNLKVDSIFSLKLHKKNILKITETNDTEGLKGSATVKEEANDTP